MIIKLYHLNEVHILKKEINVLPIPKYVLKYPRTDGVVKYQNGSLF
jgi:hypothetical protein